ncbi:protein oberon 2 [Nicotiana attenuata]|uniref:Protein oberon 2 n=1 Tax=Nicotiana attenuata TaxID=49451 RepID=A0A1J6I1U5_NICAT|nr:protein oberon 2 [Nicotiana attenuata]
MACIKERQIMDASLIANEVVDSRLKSKIPGVLCKLDIEKTYNHVNWKFLLRLMSDMGFGTKWSNWIRFCLSTVKFSILINGSPQGDPLSPFLFLTAMERLNQMINTAKSNGRIKGFKVSNRENCSLESHLLYADDSIIFMGSQPEEMLHLRLILTTFEAVADLHVSCGKSKLYQAGGLGIINLKAQNIVSLQNGYGGGWYAEVTSSGMKPDSHFGSSSCKAGNSVCASLVAENPSPETMICDLCCSEPGFCRDCCCILCCKTISSAYGGYSYIRCEATGVDGYICGHIAHIDCALRAYMAGTVGGSIGLDAEYFCRRCDSRTDLVSHVMKLLNICGSIDSRDDIEKILSVGICILRGSRKTNAKQLLHRIKSAMAKLHKGTGIRDVFKEEEFMDTNGGTSQHDTGTCVSTYHGESILSERSSPQKMTSTFDHRIESLKLEDEIDQTLQALRKSQEFEYRLAEEKLFAQKNYIMNLYEQLDKERSDLSSRTSMVETDTLLDVVLKRVDQIKREISKLKDMKQVQNGFGRTSKQILKDYFCLETESS